jgi:hypothetical protein
VVELLWTRFPTFVAGLATIGLAAWVFWLNPGRRLNRSFATLVFLQGVFLGSFMFDAFPGFGQARKYPEIALVFAGMDFAWCFITHYGGARRTPLRAAVPWLMLAAAIGCEAAYFLRHDLIEYPTAVAGHEFFAPGALAFVIDGRLPVFMGIALLFVLAYRKAPSATLRRDWLLAASAFSIVPLYYVSRDLFSRIVALVDPKWHFQLVALYATFGGILGDLLRLLVLPLLALALVVLYRHAQHLGDQRTARDANWFASLSGAVALAGFAAMGVYYFVGQHAGFVASDVTYGLVGLAFPLLLLLPVLRSQVLDVDARVRLTVKRGLVGYVFVAVVFVTVEAAAQTLSNNLSFGVGGVAAGILLFALHPLQRLAERVADQTVGRSKPIKDMDSRERHELYQEQAMIAWADGKLERKERLLLDRLREKLGLSVQDAARIESKAVGD